MGNGKRRLLWGSYEYKEMNMTDIEVQDIWFRKENVKGDEADLVAYVKLNGAWYEAIRVRMDVNLSHYSPSVQDLRLSRNLGFLMKF